MTTPSTAKKRAPLSLAQLRTPTTVYRTATSHVFTHVWKNRPWYGVTFHALKVDTRTFWCYVILGDAAILVLGFFVFAMIGQRRTKALDLALQSVGLSIRERQCGGRPALCRIATAGLAYGQRVYEWVVSALVIVRVFRGVARHRWTFDRHAVLADGELQMRFASNCPSMVLGLTINAQAVMKPWRYEPLALTNGGSLSAISDVCATPRPAAATGFESPRPGTRRTIDRHDPAPHDRRRVAVPRAGLARGRRRRLDQRPGLRRAALRGRRRGRVHPRGPHRRGRDLRRRHQLLLGPVPRRDAAARGRRPRGPQAVTFDYARLHRLDP